MSYLVQERHRILVYSHRERVLPSEPLGRFTRRPSDFGRVSVLLLGLLKSQQVVRVLLSGTIEVFESLEEVEPLEVVCCSLHDSFCDLLHFLLEHGLSCEVV